MKTMIHLHSPRPVAPRHTHRVLPALLALVLLLLVSACGGTTLPDAEPTEPPQATQAAPAAAVATDAPEPTAVPAATEPPPTDVPPTEPAPEPTDAPTAEPSSSLAGGTCLNPYLPVVSGRTLVYQSTSPLAGTTTYSITYGDTSDVGFTASFELEGQAEPFTLEWICTEEGLLSPNLSSMLGDTAGIEIEVIEASGVTLPTAAEMEVGASWATNYEMRMVFSDETIGSMVMNQSITNSSEIVGRESITVPYGTFDALRIETAGSVAMSMDLDGTPMPTPGIEINSTTWYVEGIGMVREETPDLMGTGAGPSVIELVDIQEAP